VDARELGLLAWQRTRKLVAGRWRQGANRYNVVIPASLVCPGGQPGRPRQVRKKQEARYDGGVALAEFTRAAAMLPDLLAMRRARRGGAADCEDEKAPIGLPSERSSSTVLVDRLAEGRCL